MIPSTQSSVLGWAGMFMRPEIYSLSKTNPWKYPANLWAVSPNVDNPMATEAECKHNHD